MRKILLITCLLIAGMSVQQLSAQIKGGFKMSMDLSNLNTEYEGESYNDEIDSKRLISPRLGFFMDIPVYEGFFIQPGVFGAVRGYRYDSQRIISEELFDSKEFEVVVCVDVPINFGYKYDFDKFSIFGMAGSVFSYNTYATNLYKADNEWDNDKQTIGTGEDDYVKPFNFGINFEAGIEFSCFQFSGSYLHGISNLSPQDGLLGDHQIHSNVFSISAAVLFGKL